MNTYQIIFLVFCYLLTQVALFFARTRGSFIADFVTFLGVMLNIVVALIAVSAAVLRIFTYLGTSL
jgi:fumarate reductase subunit C